MPESSLDRNLPGQAGARDRTVWELLDKGKRLDGRVLRRLRERAKEQLSARSLLIANRCLARIERMLEKTSAYQAAGIYGLLRTHERLDAGEATQHVAVISKTEITGLDALAEALRHSLTDTSSSQAGAKDPSTSDNIQANT